MRPAIPFLLVSVAVLVALGLTPDGAAISDTVLLRDRVRVGAPHYHAVYVPLAKGFSLAGEALLGWDLSRSLAWFSRVCTALAAGGVAAIARRAGHAPWAAIAAGLLVGLAPGIWFFAIAIEVHALQLLGAVGAYACADRASRSGTGAALGWILTALLVAVATHLTSVLLLPLLLWRARRRGDERGLDLRRLWRWALGATLIGSAAVAVAWPSLSTWSPVEGLATFVALFWARIEAGEFFGARDSVLFLWDEWLVRAGVLSALWIAAFARRASRPAALELAFASLPFVLIFTQGGVREAGAYFVTLYPLMAWAGAALLDPRPSEGPSDRPSPRRGPLAALAAALLVGLQAGLSRPLVHDLVHGQDIDAWGALVEERVPEGSVVGTCALTQWHRLAISTREYRAMELRAELEIVPPHVRPRVAEERLGVLGTALAQGQRVFVSAELLDAPDPTQVYTAIRAQLDAAPVELNAVPAEGPAVLYEIIVRPR